MSEFAPIPTRREVLAKILRKLASPRDLRRFLGFKFVSGDEYPYFDFADAAPRIAGAIGRLVPSRMDLGSPVFLAGLRRSGTTLFYRLMNANRHLFLFNERFPGDRMNGRGVASQHNLYNSVDDPRQFRHLTLGYLSPWIRVRFPRWGAKLALELAYTDPGSVSRPVLTRILSAFPGTRVVGITRDPRDFVISATRRGGHDAKWWIDEYLMMTDLFTELEVSCAVNFTHVRYEDLVSQPAAVLAYVCEFVGIPFESEMLDSSRWANKGPSEYARTGIVGATDKWRSATSEDRKLSLLAANACFPAAARFGYEI